MNTIKSRLAPAAAIPISSDRHASLNGILLFIVGLSLAGTGFSALRFSFLGLRVHTYLIVVGAFFPVLAITRLHLIPPRHLFNLLLFATFYFITTIPARLDVGEGIKIYAAVATIIVMAILVRDWNDFVAGVLGMCLAVAILSIKGLETEAIGMEGINAFDSGGHRNTFSLYALPPLLLGGYVLISGKHESFICKLLISISLFFSSLVICLNTNRSGWLGLAIVVLLIIRNKSTKAVAIIIPLGIALYFLITTMFGIEHLKIRAEGTHNSQNSDRLRWQLIESSFRIAIAHPLLGVSPQELPFELAKELGFGHSHIFPHNVYAHIAGGSGLVGLFLMLHVGVYLARWKPPVPLPARGGQNFRQAQLIMRSILIVWMVRGCFTHEIIYTPAFCMAIGLALGLELCSASNHGKSTSAMVDGARRQRL